MRPPFREAAASNLPSNSSKMAETNKVTDSERLAIVRPTEAQLRWAQFHHKKRAQEVQERVQHMWQTPLNVQDVPDTLSEDGRSTSSESSARISPSKKRSKPKISRGRRALLRVSKRAYQQRREDIAKHGFQCSADKENDDELMDAESEDVVNDMFDPMKKRKQKRRQRRKSRLSRALGVTDDEERVRRFEAAYAMMMSLKPQEEQHEIITPSKRWTRPADLPVSVSIDGRSYEAWKWGLTRRQTRRRAARGSPTSDMPFDRRASWLVHLPLRESSARKQMAVGPDGQPIEPNISLYADPDLLLSPGQMKFDELVRLLQERSSSHPDFDLPENGHVHHGAALSQYEEHLRQLYEAQQAEMDESPRVGKRLGRRNSPGGESEFNFFQHGRNMHDNVPPSMQLGPDDEDAKNEEPSRKPRASVGKDGRRSSVGEHSVGASSIGDESDFFRHARNMHDTVPVRAADVDNHDDSGGDSRKLTGRRRTSHQDPDLGAIPESDVAIPTPQAKKDTLTRGSPEGRASVHSSASSSFRLGARMGGLLNKMTGGRADEETLRAVAAFRKTRDKKQGDDGSGSTSTFYILPENIRRAVKGFASKSGEQHSQEAKDRGDEAVDDSAEDHHDEDDYAENEALSPNRSSPSRRTGVSSIAVSPEHGIELQHRVLEHTAFLASERDPSDAIIDTDDTTSDASGAKMDPQTAALLLLSPTILTKRHQQAIHAVEKRKWEQVSYLISANPWLAEMMEVTTEQYLLHKVALYGGGEGEIDPETGEIVNVKSPSSPVHLNKDLIRMFPAAVHKFDKDGNLPLHMAAASGNVAMVNLLGDRFSSGASVRNEDGMLPLHLGIQACVNPLLDGKGDLKYGADFVTSILKLFPGAVAVSDNEGDLPIHIAATNLQGDEGVDIVYTLLDEADRQAHSDAGIRFADISKKKMADEESLTGTDITATATDPSNNILEEEDNIHCNMVRNEMNRTPLSMAIRSMAGWEVIEALAGGPGGDSAALYPDEYQNNALHLLVGEEFGDPAAALSILKIVPNAASVRNGEGMLPIEIASMQEMPREVIFALALVDLPIDLDENDSVKVRDGYGGSWWFLSCECDDHQFDIVEEIIAICSYPQLRELCFMKGGRNGADGPVISRATPKCRQALRKALRFVERFEFVSNSALHVDHDLGLKIFEALDYGTARRPFEEGRRVLLRCYDREKPYLLDSAPLRDYALDFSLVEEMFDFAVHELPGQPSTPQQFVLVIERPSLTLDRVVDGMQKNEEVQHKDEMRTRYLSKICMVLRLVAKSLRHLHNEGLVHGDVCLENCGKFDDKWKLTNLLGMRKIGEVFGHSRLGESSGPEAVELLHDMAEGRSREYGKRRAAFVSELKAAVSIDMWGFGKLAFEALTGEALIEFDPEKDIRGDNNALMEILQWDKDSLRDVIDSLQYAGVSTLGVDLVSHCLMPDPKDRPANMDEILNHPFWKDFRRRTASSTRSTTSTRSSLKEV